MIDFKSKFGRFAKKHLRSEYFIWLTTVDFTGTPQPRPVWFIWENDSILIFSQVKAHKVKHIRKNPNVALHFNTEDHDGEKRLIILQAWQRLKRRVYPRTRTTHICENIKVGFTD